MSDEIVRQGYDSIAAAYAAQRDQESTIAYLERFVSLLPAAGRVLDLGCGAGLPIDRYLLDHGFDVLGLDVSASQIELARQNNPAASYVVKDMQALAPGEYQLDGIVSFYAIFHTPRTAHARLFQVLHSFLTPDRPLLVTMGAGEWEGVEHDFHGVDMFWSHYGPETNHQLIEEAGFKVILDEIDSSGGERHQVVLATA